VCARRHASASTNGAAESKSNAGDKCSERGVIVRPVAGYALPDHLRVTVGLPEENQRFLAALASALESA